jgi:hypothetical protein
MVVNYNYVNTAYDTNKEKVLSVLCNNAKEHIELPNKVYIQISKLEPNVLGDTVLDFRLQNKIRLNSILNIKESVYVLSHELIHLSQIHIGQLKIHKNGNYIWENRQYMNLSKLKQLSFLEYQQLPWELDVAKKQQKLLENLLKI